jgi:DNA gyrase inhibitor GyrI
MLRLTEEVTRMDYRVTTREVQGRPIAAARTRTTWDAFPDVWRPLLDRVYAVLRDTGAVEFPGRNVIVYRPGGSESQTARPEPVEGSPAGRRSGSTLDLEVGVEAVIPFEPRDDVRLSRLPAGRVAWTLHIGPYHRLADAHRAVIEWCEAQGLALTGTSWEVYGHWRDDPDDLETDVYHLLA